MNDIPANPATRPSEPTRKVAEPAALAADPAAKAPTLTPNKQTAASTTPDKPRAKAPLQLSPTQELEVLIRARYPIIYITTWEEERAEHCLREIAKRREKNLYLWTITDGIVKAGSEPSRSKLGTNSTTDPVAALDAVLAQVEPAIYLFKDFHPFTEDQRCNLTVIRRLRDAAHQLRDSYKTIVITSPLMKIAPELSKDITVVDFGLPAVEDFGSLLNRIIEDVKGKAKITIDLDAEGRERLLRAARGLTLREAENVFAKTLVMDGKLNADDVSIVFSEKQQIIKKSGLLEYYEATEKMSHVAGLDNLKQWLAKRSIAFSDRAARFGLPAPRGVMLLGVQGCGKSLCVKAIANSWKLPLLRFDVGRMFSSLVGSSEENMRRAVQIAESVAPCILWCDEIDKALAGATSAGGSDGGTSARVFGTLLTWLSEKTAPVFLAATANNISHLPPELLRKGRLDEIFFVDLPNEQERRDVFYIHLARRGRDPREFDLALLSQASDGFNGAEIEEAIVSALFDAFSKQVKLNTEIIEASVRETVPLSRTMSEDLERLRSWASGRARLASTITTTQAAEVRRKIEL
ncbi:MAG: AAA family ATPase [Pirellulales bacterium]|nr:AAA family ATPase [Pirellulales bacterium]